MARLNSRQASAHRVALRIAAIYALFALLWMLLSDSLAMAIAWNKQVLVNIERAKGVAFVVITALLVYSLIRRHLRRLQASEQRFRTLIDAAPIGIATSRNGYTLYANRAYGRMFGWDDAGKMAGRSLLEDIAPPYRAEIIERNRRRERGEPAPSAYETVGLRKNGDTFPLLIDVARIDLDDQPTTLVFGRDGTERKQADTALRESEARLRAIFDSANQAIILLDRNFEVLAFNSFAEVAVRQVYGQQLAIGQSIYDYGGSADQEDFTEHFARALTGQSLTIENQIIGRETVSWWEFYFNPIVDAQGVTGITFMARDITKRKLAEEELRTTEERLRTVVANAPIILFALDRHGVYTLAMGKAGRGLGITPDDIVGRAIADVPNYNPAMHEHVQRVLAGETLTTIDQYNAATFETRWAPIWDDHGNVSGVLGVATDITERQRAELRLRETEAREEAILNGTSDAVFLKDVAGHYLLINPACAWALGRAMPDVLGRTDNELLDPITATRMLDEDRRVIETGAACQSEVELTIDGVAATYLTLKTPYRDTYGRIRGVIGVARDITDRQWAEQALRRSEATNRALVNALPDLMFLLSADGVFIDYKAVKDHGLYQPPERFIGRHITEVLPPDLAHQTLEHVARALQTGETQIYEYQLPLDGALADYEARLAVSETGEILAVVRDITDRKRMERTLRDARDVYLTLVEEAPLLVWRTDLDGGCTFVNKQWIAFTGLSAEQGAGQAYVSRIHPDDRPAFSAVFDAALRDRRSFDAEFRMRRHDGVYRWMALQSASYYDERGMFGGYVSMCSDITERKRQEQIKDDFLALASHELKTPLAALLGYIHLLERWSQKYGFGARVDQALAAMTGEGARLDRLINDLLDVSRIQTGRLRLHIRPVRVVELVSQAVANLRMSIETHPLVLDLPADPAIQIEADHQRLEQIVVNLVTNAAKYSPAQTPITIRLRAEATGVALTISDGGLGIPQDDLPYIFDRFYQVQRPTRESRPGLGLGLYITNEIVRQHGGTISVHSVEHYGSHFTVRLPYHAPTAEELHGAVAHRMPATG